MKIMKGGGKDQVCVMAIKKDGLATWFDGDTTCTANPKAIWLPQRQEQQHFQERRRERGGTHLGHYDENYDRDGNGTCIGDWDEDFEKYLPVMFIWAPLASLFAWMSAMSSGNRPLRETPDKK